MRYHRPAPPPNLAQATAADNPRQRRLYLACGPSEHERFKVDLATFTANVCGLYECASARFRYLNGTCARCHSDVSMRIGPPPPHAPTYKITRDLVAEVR